MQNIHLSKNKTKYFLSSVDLLNAVDKLGKKGQNNLWSY